MENFPKPQNLNGSELMQELAAQGIEVAEVVDFADGTIGFETEQPELAAQIVAAHDGTILAPEPSVDDKLASVGLSLDDLKAALGV